MERLQDLRALLREGAVGPQQRAVLVELLEQIALGVATLARVTVEPGLPAGASQFTQARAWVRVAEVYARLLGAGGGS